VRKNAGHFPFIERIYGDGGYRGAKAAKAAARTGRWRIEVVERSATAVGFEVLPKRWIVESNIRLGQPVSPPGPRFRTLWNEPLPPSFDLR